MKKAYGIFILFMYCILLAGCGGRADTLEDGLAEYTDILSDMEAVFDGDGIGRTVGLQFYKNEPVQIWASRNGTTTDIYLCREDGSKEFLLEGMPEDYYYARWFMDDEGNFYRSSTDSLVKMDVSGKELYSIPLKDIGTIRIVDICQLADSRVLITYMQGTAGSYYTLSEVDASTGEVSKVSKAKLDGMGRVAAGEKGLLYMDTEGVYEIDMENGSKTCVLSFIGTSYLLKQEDMEYIEDFRMLEDGSVEILRYDRGSWSGISEILRVDTKVTEKTVLTMRCCSFSKEAYGTNGWLKNQITLFNQRNGSYMVVLDECPEGTERVDFSRQTSIEIAAGKGPDIIFGDVLGDYVYGAIQKGALVDLVPYMEASGIREEDYFPAAFNCWKVNGGIYGVCPSIWLESYRINQEVLGGYSEPDVETLVNALLAWPEDAVFISYRDSQWVLEYLLQGSENICGMVDWEAGTCDFSGELFAKILQAAKRYGNDERKNYPEVAELRPTDLMCFDTAADRKAEGMAVAGVLFDDGCHAAIANAYQGDGNKMLAVNTNSAHIDGAWEFICFLLGEEAQSALDYITPPVNRKAFEICMKREVATLIERKVETYAYSAVGDSGQVWRKYPRSYANLTEEKMADYMELLENARALPIRTVPILDIIYEEAEYYFNGTKSIEQVSVVVENKVQLYMDENN